MDITEAFTQGAIETTGVDVGGHEENELREVIQHLLKLQEIEMTREEENICVLCFVAGRAYQEDLETPVMMTRALKNEFLEFLLQRGPA